MTDLQPGTPEFLAAVRRDVQPHVLAANDEHDAKFAALLDSHERYVAMVQASTEHEKTKHGLMNRARKDAKRQAARLRLERAEALRRGSR